MSRRATAPISLSPGQARDVLERLVRDRVVSPNEVSRYVSELQSEIDALEARLYRLRQAMGDGAPRVASPVRPRRVVGCTVSWGRIWKLNLTKRTWGLSAKLSF